MASFSVEQITATHDVLEYKLSEWNGMSARTERDIVQPREFAGVATIRQLLSGHDDHSRNAGTLVARWFLVFWGG